MMISFNKKIWTLGALTATLLIALIIPSVPFASSNTVTICDEPRTSYARYVDVLVKSGFSCHLYRDVTVSGNVVVEDGAKFTASRIQIGGNVLADGADHVGLSRVTVGGNVQVKNTDNNRGIVNVALSTIQGNLQIEDNYALFVKARDNTVVGDLQYTKNTSVIKTGNKITGNTIGGNLDCGEDNSYMIYGSNVVAGLKTGQCAD